MKIYFSFVPKEAGGNKQHHSIASSPFKAGQMVKYTSKAHDQITSVAARLPYARVKSLYLQNNNLLIWLEHSDIPTDSYWLTTLEQKKL